MRSRCLVVLCLAACPAALANGSPLPAAQYSIDLANSPEINEPGSFSQGGEAGEIENLPAPLVHAHLAGQGTSRVQMQYWFRVSGPQDGVHVPVEIAGRVAISAGNAVFQKHMVWGVTAQLNALSFDGPLGPGVNQVDSQSGAVNCNPNSVGDIPVVPPIPSCPATDQDQPVLLTLDTLSGADNEISMVAAVNDQEAFSADFDARVDPVISFAPGFDATGYSIALSDGVGNTVPEPSQALLTITAMAILLPLRRRALTDRRALPRAPAPPVG